MAASDKGTTGKAAPAEATNFIRDIIQGDLAAGRVGSAGRVVTRFPPEPNGWPHIGHAKSICLNFGLARDFGGVCHLRFDDTNPTTEDMEYVEAIQRDVRWLGFDWADKLFFASDYYERLYQYGVQLIEAGKAYVCSLSEDDIRKYRGTAYEPGVPSPYRDRSVAENLDLFRRMRAGEFPDGAHVLRGKIDMQSPNLKMRDWPFYRIRHANHYRTGDAWCIYPLYDFAHCLSDLIEGITHSVCTLEFENNRELYDWIVDAVLEGKPNAPRPHQYEFARLEVASVMTSKRKLLQLVESGRVSGWDDPRMPTLAGLRRRGYTASALRAFCDRVGVAKNNSTVEHALLEHVLREDLDPDSPRVLAVLRPLRVVIDTWPEDRVEEIDAPYWPAVTMGETPKPPAQPAIAKEGTRKLPMSRVLYVDRDDFMEDPPKDFHRLAPGREVRLRHAYVIRCDRVVKDEAGEIVELHCSHDAATRGADPQGRKVRGTIQWVSAGHAAEAEVRLYDRLFSTDSPGSSGDFLQELNPSSLVTVRAKVEPSLGAALAGDRFQFERLGFFVADSADSRPGAPVFNRTVALKDTWARMIKSEGERAAAPSAPEKEKPAPRATPTEAPSPLSAEAQRLRDAHGLPDDDARILGADPAVAAFFEEAVGAHPGGGKSVARWIVNEVLRVAKGGVVALPFKGAAVGELVALIDRGTISGKIAKDVFAEMRKSGERPGAIVEKRGSQQISDTGAIEAAVAAVLSENADAVARYRAGNENLLGAFVGMVMKKTGGKANPKLVNELLRARLSAPG
jgi:glutaminyl-tRNA synthetase